MALGLEVGGAITAGGLSVLTTGTGYATTQTLTEDAINNLLHQTLAYTNNQLGLNYDITSVYPKAQADSTEHEGASIHHSESCS